MDPPPEAVVVGTGASCEAGADDEIAGGKAPLAVDATGAGAAGADEDEAAEAAEAAEVTAGNMSGETTYGTGGPMERVAGREGGQTLLDVW